MKAEGESVPAVDEAVLDLVREPAGEQHTEPACGSVLVAVLEIGLVKERIVGWSGVGIDEPDCRLFGLYG